VGVAVAVGVAVGEGLLVGEDVPEGEGDTVVSPEQEPKLL